MSVSDKKSPKIGMGIISLIVILTVLCLAVFSAMTLSMAIGERNLSIRTSEAVHAYYRAETACTQIANQIVRLWERDADQEMLLDFAETLDLDCQIDGNIVYFSYSCAIDDGQALFVEIVIDDAFRIVKWQTETTVEWVPDDSIAVWDGEMFD